MQTCRMNNDTFTRYDDGRLFLNGKEIIKNKVDDNTKLFNVMILSIILGASVSSLVTLILVS